MEENPDLLLEPPAIPPLPPGSTVLENFPSEEGLIHVREFGEDDDEEIVDFGFEEVSADEKQQRVEDVFHSVAYGYDMMNDILSLGAHRIWKRETVLLSQVRPGDRVLDLASGSGDLAYLFFKKVGPLGQVIMTDINGSMLEVGRQKMENRGECAQIQYALANAETIPFADNTFDVVSIGFGLRNVSRKRRALREMLRVLKPGGRVVVLEFSKPVGSVLNMLYDVYSFKFLPKFGKWIAKDEASYRYLAESIRRHPNQEDLAKMMTDVGFDQVAWASLSGGIVAVHRGFKY